MENLAFVSVSHLVSLEDAKLLPYEILNQEGENEAISRYPFSMNLFTMCVN